MVNKIFIRSMQPGGGELFRQDGCERPKQLRVYMLLLCPTGEQNLICFGNEGDSYFAGNLVGEPG